MSSGVRYSEKVNYLLSSKAIRDTCARIFDRTISGEGQFHIDLDKLPDLADQLIELTNERFPDKQVPFHARLRHFRSPNRDRIANYLKTLTNETPLERSQSIMDLIVVSVLLDAGAGKHWQYKERESGEVYSRSEGLAIASYHMFREGLFSSSYQARVEAEALSKLPVDSLAHGLQVTPDNPIIGLEARTEVLNRLGTVLATNKTVFPNGRPGDLIYFIHQNYGSEITAGQLLHEVLKVYNHVWPGRPAYEGVPLGDTWYYPPFEQDGEDDIGSYVTIHKLPQWLSYSLVEPIEAAGIKVKNLDEMTGLAEYRNGGIFVDSSVISLKNDSLMDQEHALDSEVVIEWRALTIILLDKLAEIVRDKLDLSKEEMPLVKILEGGTWALGRKLALEKRADGSSPIKLSANGSTF